MKLREESPWSITVPYHWPTGHLEGSLISLPCGSSVVLGGVGKEVGSLAEKSPASYYRGKRLGNLEGLVGQEPRSKMLRDQSDWT